MFKRISALVATLAIVALTFAPAASAVPNPNNGVGELGPYGAGATAQALELTLLGKDLAVSQTTAAINSKPEAKADGAALLLAGQALPGPTPAAAPGGKASNKSCVANVNLSDLTGGAISLADAGLACVTTDASATDTSTTSATSGSGEVVINVLAPGGTLLKPLLDPLFTSVTQVTDPLLVALRPITGVVNDLTQINLETVLNNLLAQVQNTNVVLAQIAVAPTAARVHANTADGVVAEAGAQGVSIKILPGLAQSLVDLGLDIPLVTQPLATVQIGASTATVSREPKHGTLVSDASTAKLLSIKLNDTLGILQGVTGQASSAINGLATGPLGCNANNPLAGIICLDLGTVKTLTPAELTARNMNFGPGTIGREATAALVHVLAMAASSLGCDVIGMKLADSTAAVYSTEDGPITTPTTPPPATPLPKTGGSVPLPLGLGLLALAGLSATLVKRSRAV
jgi:hypothetical protein